LQFVPDAATAAVLCQVTTLNQGSQVLLQGVAIASRQPDRIAHRDPAMLSREFDDLQ
jgi:alpha-D-ribose 1-methylphosphonate 5-triphosphate synthase subunit PhnH